MNEMLYEKNRTESYIMAHECKKSIIEHACNIANDDVLLAREIKSFIEPTLTQKINIPANTMIFCRCDVTNCKHTIPFGCVVTCERRSTKHNYSHGTLTSF